MKPARVDLATYQSMVNLFHDESDRGAAVLAGSVAEGFLAEFLKSKMIDSPDLDSLFEGFGPLSTFHQRIETAFAFGFISSCVRSDLQLIKKIRNQFAHHPVNTSFAHQPITDWCAKLTTSSVIPLQGEAPDPVQDNRGRYLIAIGLAVAGWHITMRSETDAT